MKIAERILSLIQAAEAANNPNQGEPSRRYQQRRLELAKDSLHNEIAEEIAEAIAKALDSDSHS